MNQLQKWLQSSQDPTQVANKVKGVILMGSSVVIMGAAFLFHIHLSATDVVTLATEISGIAGAVWAIYGCILHLITFIGTVRQNGEPVPVPPVPVTVTPV